MTQAQLAEDRVEEFLREGMFYHALAEFIVDLPIFPFACIKGPMVQDRAGDQVATWRRAADRGANTQDVLAAGVAVRPLVDARRGGHCVCQRDREVTAYPC